MLGLAMVGGVFSLVGGRGTVSAQAQAQALNPCTLLTVDEIQQLTAEASAGDGVSSPLEAVRAVACRYAWGAGVNRLKLDVVVNEASQMFPGMKLATRSSSDSLESARKPERLTLVTSGRRRSRRVHVRLAPTTPTATAALKGRVVAVRVDGRVAREKKDQVIALLKAAVSRL